MQSTQYSKLYPINFIKALSLDNGQTHGNDTIELKQYVHHICTYTV